MQSQPRHTVIPQVEKKRFSFSLKQKIAAFVGVLILIFIWSIVWTVLALQSIKVGDFSTADTEARIAHPIVRFLNFVTFHKNSEIQLWDKGLTLIQQTYSLETAAQNYLKLALQNDPQLAYPSRELEADLKSADATFVSLLPILEKSIIYKAFILPKLPATVISQLKPDSQLVKTLPVFEAAVDSVFTGHRRFVLLLQNSDELRATGGFMGSYAIIELNQGALSPIQFYDIYDADGQVQLTIPAPAGVNEYLSGGQGLRLPNANWNPDFPSSAQDILQFFALAKVQDLDGVIAVNLSLVQQLLEITGPVQVADFNQTVTAGNLADVARADRLNYFPGSKQKKNFLQSLSTQLRIKLQGLTPAQEKRLAVTVVQDVEQKNMQFFFHDTNLQTFIQSINATGQMTSNLLPAQVLSSLPQDYLMLVESNVGINKANKNITREVKIDLSDKKATLQIHFENNNPLTLGTPVPPPSNVKENPRNDYINYQRVLIPSGSVVTSLEQDGAPVPIRDQNEVISASGEHFTQIGFLAPVPEQKQSTITLEYTQPNSFQLNPTLVIQKQSGLPSTFYSVTYGSQTQNFQLDRDKVIQFLP